jgi:hypothetical protein
MASFAERMGHRQARSAVQSDSLDDDTRVALWNVFSITKDLLDPDFESSVLTGVWIWEFKNAHDKRPDYDHRIWAEVKAYILRRQWWEVLDLIEAIVRQMWKHADAYSSDAPEAIAGGFNNCFERFLVGYRFVGLEITPIDSTAEANAVVGAQEDAVSIAGARHALDRAVELLADRQMPDYPNSIKESISAVEAVVKKVTGEGTLGKGLTKLEGAGLTVHPALKGAWSQMYGWTSNDDGIRHGGIEAAAADQALAKYVLVTCSAFVSYLIEEGRKAGLL